MGLLGGKFRLQNILDKSATGGAGVEVRHPFGGVCSAISARHPKNLGKEVRQSACCTAKRDGGGGGAARGCHLG